MKTIKQYLRRQTFLLFVGLFSMNGLAQVADTLVKCDHSFILAKVVEINDAEIKYKMHNYLDGPTITTARNSICEIRYGNGMIEKIRPIIVNGGTPVTTTTVPANEIDSSRVPKDISTIVKFDMWRFAFNSVEIDVEHVLRPGLSVEGGIGYIGLNPNAELTRERINESGVLMRAGIKFFQKPTAKPYSPDYINMMHGKYFKTELAFSSYTYQTERTFWDDNLGNTVETTDVRASAGALLMKGGHQWIIANVLVLDLHIGGGIGFSNDRNFSLRRYSHQSFGGLAWDLGFRVGVAF